MDLFITVLFAFIGLAFPVYLLFIMLKGRSAPNTTENESQLHKSKTGKPLTIDTEKNIKTDSSCEELQDYDIETDAKIGNESDFLQNTDMTKLFVSPFRIEPGVLPPTPGYNVLNKYEYVFFNKLKSELLSANVKGECFLTRLSCGTFNVN